MAPHTSSNSAAAAAAATDRAKVINRGEAESRLDYRPRAAPDPESSNPVRSGRILTR